MELCAGSCSSPQGQQSFSQFPLLPPALQMSTQLYFSSLPCSHSVPSSHPDSGLLGAGFYQLQLGSFPEDQAPACSENLALRRVQINFSSPSSPVPPIPDFGIIGGLLCTPSSISSAPIQHSEGKHSRSKQTWRLSFTWKLQSVVAFQATLEESEIQDGSTKNECFVIIHSPLSFQTCLCIHFF